MTKKLVFIAPALAIGALGLSACSQETQQAASETASSAADDVATNAAAVGAAAKVVATEGAKAVDKIGDQASMAASDAKQRQEEKNDMPKGETTPGPQN